MMTKNPRHQEGRLHHSYLTFLTFHIYYHQNITLLVLKCYESVCSSYSMNSLAFQWSDVVEEYQASSEGGKFTLLHQYIVDLLTPTVLVMTINALGHF